MCKATRCISLFKRLPNIDLVGASLKAEYILQMQQYRLWQSSFPSQSKKHRQNVRNTLRMQNKQASRQRFVRRR